MEVDDYLKFFEMDPEKLNAEIRKSAEYHKSQREHELSKKKNQ